MKFDDCEILQYLEAASAEQMESLNFGVVRMNADATVTFYNAFESKLSGLDKKNVLGRRYFEEVAPCTNNYMISQRFLDEPEMDVVLRYVFSFRMKPTPVRLRLLRSVAAKSMYLLVERFTA